jgi:hypothetical protein
MRGSPALRERRATSCGSLGPPGSSYHPVSTFSTDGPLRRCRVRRQDRRRDLTGSRRARSRGRRCTRRDCPGCTPGTATGTTGTTEAVRVPHHRVVLVAVVAVTRMLPEGIAGEEDDRDDEHDPGDDRDPGRELKDPGGPVYHLGCRRRRGQCCGTSPHSWGFRCFTHETHDAAVNNSCGCALLKCQL